jgi:hypothetical protein
MMWTKQQLGHDTLFPKINGVFLTLKVWRISPHTVRLYSVLLALYSQTTHDTIKYSLSTIKTSVPEFIDPVFAKTSSKRSFSVIENESVGACFRKNWVYKFGH